MSDQPATVSIEDAYREACTALGEAIVRERLLARLQAQQATGQDEPAPQP